MRRILHTVIAGSCLLLAGTSLSAQTDLLKILTDYADAMIEDGRDDSRYGENTSPLFATMLRRDTDRPVMLPYPQIPVLEKNSEPGHRWLYYSGTNFINIPFLGGEKLHKLTVSGEDVLENYGLYRMLYVLSEISNDSSYKNAADEALKWWYQNTQGPSGLFPWGEHLGWDFRYDFITYHVPGHEDFYNHPVYDYDGTPKEQWGEKFVPITQLYQAFQHEPRTPDLSGAILLENLKNLPLEQGEIYTPLEKFAFGCWKEHVIDLQSGGYNRHGDYFGRRWGVEGPWGGDGNFPRIIGQFFDYWSYTWMHTNNSIVKDSLETIMEVMVDYLESDKDSNGIIHKYYGQVWQAAAGAELAANRISAGNEILSQKLKQFANAQIDALYTIWPEGSDLNRMISVWFITGREDIKPYLISGLEEILKVSPSNISSASDFAYNIRNLVLGYQIFHTESYLLKAEDFVRLAVRKMFDDYSPLPRINTTNTLYSGDGTGYVNYYHAPGGSDDLMWALSLYVQEAGRILENIKPVADAGTNQMVMAGDQVNLDGSRSENPEGGSLSYLWHTPQEIIIIDPAQVYASFIAPQVDTTTIFEISLVVNNGLLDSEPDLIYIIVQSTVGISDQDQVSLSIYPNPFIDRVNILAKGHLSADMQVEVRDMTGRLVYSVRLQNSVLVMDLQNLSPGIYALQLKSKNYSVIRKIVKKRIS